MPKKAASKKAKKDEDEVEEIEQEEKPKRGKKRAAKTEESSEEEEEVEEKPAKKAKAAPKKEKKEKKETKEKKEAPAKKGPTKTSVDASYYTTPAKAAGQLKIVSWNVAGFKSIMGKDFLNYLENEDPDVICLQETKITEEAALANELPPHYHSYFLASNKSAGYAGVGIMSKIKPISVKRGIDNEEHDKEGRVLTAEYDKFYLVSVYVPNSGTKGLDRLDYRTKQWDVDFLAFLKKLEETKPVIWCGDLNVAHNAIDLKNPKTNKKSAGFTDAERESFTKMLASGFVDSFRHFYPTKEGAYSFWSYMGGARAKDVGWRLDYFIVSKDFMPNVVDSVIRTPIMGSDHCPIMLLLKA